MALQQIRVVNTQEFIDRKQQPGATGPQNIGGFSPLKARIQRYQDTAQALGANCGDNPLIDIRCPDGYPVALFDTCRQKRLGRSYACHVQLGISELHIAVAYRHPVAKSGGGLGDYLGQCSGAIPF